MLRSDGFHLWIVSGREAFVLRDCRDGLSRRMEKVKGQIQGGGAARGSRRLSWTFSSVHSWCFRIQYTIITSILVSPLCVLWPSDPCDPWKREDYVKKRTGERQQYLTPRINKVSICNNFLWLGVILLIPLDSQSHHRNMKQKQNTKKSLKSAKLTRQCFYLSMIKVIIVNEWIRFTILKR